MWTGTPYDRWQKRLGVTLFLLVVVPLLVLGGVDAQPGMAIMYALGIAFLAVWCAMVGLLILKKLYFFWARRNGRIPY